MINNGIIGSLLERLYKLGEKRVTKAGQIVRKITYILLNGLAKKNRIFKLD